MSTARTSPELSADHPFPGLRPFLFEDAAFFFGREDQFFSLYRFFDHSRFVAVVGSSGSGKSSLVRAGLLPLLDKESREPTGRIWKMIQMHPGDSPIGSLATAIAQQLFTNVAANIVAARRERIRFALRRSSFGMSDALREIEGIGDSSIILVVDQFEELFRYAAKRQGAVTDEETQRHEEATQFVQLLLGASRERARNVYVLLTMRSDFIGDCAKFHGLPEAVSASQFLVPSLTRDQREEAIRGPIKKAGARIKPELVERLLNDSGDDIDQLPVLQHCLSRLWDQAAAGGTSPPDGRELTMEHYGEVGGISHALSKHADEILNSLPDAVLTVEQTFRSLAEIDNEGRIIRRARLLKDLLAETGVPPDSLRLVVDRFRDDDCSFLTPSKSETPELADDTRIDVGHEALLRCWERVSGDPRTGSPYTGWLRAEVADGRMYRGLLSMAESRDRIGTDTVEERWKRWSERPRTAAWAERYGGHIEEVERLFRESLAWLDTEREQQRRREEEAADRQRIEIESKAAREREAAALRFAGLARRAVIAVSILLVIALGLGAMSVWEWRNADRLRVIAQGKANDAAEQSAVAREQQAKAANSLQNLIFLVTRLLDTTQELVDIGQISIAGAKKFLTVAEQAPTQFDIAGQTPEFKSSRVTLLVAFADVYEALQDDKNALKSAKLAQDIAIQLVAESPNNPAYQRLLYSADFNCGDAASNLLLPDDSMRDYNDALAIARNWAINDPTNYRWMSDVAFIMNKIGDTYDQLGRPEQALQTYQATLEINQKLAGDYPNNNDLQRDLATALTRVGDAEADSDAGDALAKYNAAFTIRKTLADNDRGNTGLQSNLATAYSRLASIAVQQNHFADATSLYANALQIRQKLEKNDRSNATWQSDLAQQYTLIGDMLAQKPDKGAAVDNYRTALNFRLDLADIDRGNFRWMKALADSYTKLAGALVSQGKLPDGLNEHNAALRLRVTLSTQFPDNVTRQKELIGEYVAIGDILKQNDSMSALAQYKNAINVILAFSSGHPGVSSLEAERQSLLDKIKNLTAKSL